jgi:hypothetical protein
LSFGKIRIPPTKFLCLIRISTIKCLWDFVNIFDRIRIPNIESKAFFLLCRQIIFSGLIRIVDSVLRIFYEVKRFSLFIFYLIEQKLPRIADFLELLDMGLANSLFDEDISLFLPFYTEIWNQNLRYKDRLVCLKLVD